MEKFRGNLWLDPLLQDLQLCKLKQSCRLRRSSSQLERIYHRRRQVDRHELSGGSENRKYSEANPSEPNLAAKMRRRYFSLLGIGCVCVCVYSNLLVNVTQRSQDLPFVCPNKSRRISAASVYVCVEIISVSSSFAQRPPADIQFRLIVARPNHHRP